MTNTVVSAAIVHNSVQRIGPLAHHVIYALGLYDHAQVLKSRRNTYALHKQDEVYAVLQHDCLQHSCLQCCCA